MRIPGQDLQDSELLIRYWQTTGTEFQTYWIPETELTTIIDHYMSGVDDCQIFDNHLNISFRQDSNTVSFGYINRESIVAQIASKLREQNEVGATSPFIQLKPPTL